MNPSITEQESLEEATPVLPIVPFKQVDQYQTEEDSSNTGRITTFENESSMQVPQSTAH